MPKKSALVMALGAVSGRIGELTYRPTSGVIWGDSYRVAHQKLYRLLGGRVQRGAEEVVGRTLPGKNMVPGNGVQGGNSTLPRGEGRSSSLGWISALLFGLSLNLSSDLGFLRFLGQGSQWAQGADESELVQPPSGGGSCRETLTLFDGMNPLSGLDEADLGSLIHEERYKFSSLIAAGDQNLAWRNPALLMNAAQHLWAMVHSVGVSQMRVGLTRTRLPKYNFFSGGTPTTDGISIQGHEEAIAAVMGQVEALVDQSRSGLSMILLAGPVGTGKTRFADIFSAGYKNLVLSRDPTFAVMTYDWVGLEEIPSLVPFLHPRVDKEGHKVYPPVKAIKGDSPFTLLPEVVQDRVIESVGSVASGLLGGRRPNPWRSRASGNEFYRTELIAHYAKRKGRSLSPREIVDILDRHVVIRRRTNIPVAVFDKQVRGANLGEMFLSEDGLTRIRAGVEAHHPLSYTMGTFLNAHGGLVIMDEFLRSDPGFLDFLLGVSQNRQVYFEGASEPFDAVMFAATNKVNLEDFKEGKGEAVINRVRVIQMPGTPDPLSIARTLMADSGAVFQQDIQSPNAPIVRANLDQLFPPREDGPSLKFLTPTHRFRTYIGEGPGRVEVAPHTWEFISEIVGSTRMVTDPLVTMGVTASALPQWDVFRSVISRLHLWEGIILPGREVRELDRVTRLVGEGQSGILHRDAARWLMRAVEVARRIPVPPGETPTLTPAIAMEVLWDMLNDGVEGSFVIGNKERVDYWAHAEAVRDQILVGRVDDDINRAFGDSNGLVVALYWKVLKDISTVKERGAEALDEDSRKRLEEVREVYKKRSGKDLPIETIALYHPMEVDGETGRYDKESIYQPLFQIVQTYFNTNSSRFFAITAVADYDRTREGSGETVDAHRVIMEGLRRLGYNSVAARAALHLKDFVSRRSGGSPPR